MFRKIIHKIWKLSFYLITLVGIYSLWSRLYRWFYHGDYKDIPIDWKLTPEQADEKCQTLTWTKDGPRELFDAIGSPQWVQHCINSVKATDTQPEGSLDCDEFAVWCASSLDPRYCPLVLSISYMKKDSLKPNGHNVCIYLDKKINSIFHIGNWGIIGPYSSLELVVKDVCYTSNSDLIGWALYDYSLKNLHFSIQYPSKIKFYDLMEFYYSVY
jgi:hypothetical protein